nr:reverse transcriptase domain-containing protein [Tanacetum cinerariifolium]
MIPKRCNRRHSKQIVKLELRTIIETLVATMAETRTMSELLRAPTKGYRDAIVIHAILAEDFELKGTQQATMKGIEETCVTYGGPHPYYECPAASGNTINACAAVETHSQRATTTQSGISYDGPTIPPTSSPLLKEVEHEPEVRKDKPNPKPSIPYPLRLNDQKLREKTNNQMLKFLQILQRLHFALSFVDALLHIPNGPPKKLLEKLGDPGRFLIPCDFHGLESCMSLADVGASINLMPLFVWKKLSLYDLTRTRMTLELDTRSIAYPAGIAEDIFVLTPFETSGSLLEEFADELALPDQFPLGNKDDNFNLEADHRKIKYLVFLNPSTESNFKIVDPILKKFIDGPALDYLPPLGDDDDDLFDLKSDNDEWKKLLYSDSYKDIDSKKIKTWILK